MRGLAKVWLAACMSVLLPEVVRAQYYDWGRSPQGIRWLQSKGDSLRIVFPDYYRLHAARTAGYMSAMRPDVGYGFRKGPMRLPVVLHTENFVSNGIVLWAPKRIELEAIPSAAPFAESWLQQLTSHEYRHAVQYNNLYGGFMKGVGYLLGQQSGLLSTVMLPIWCLEGDAVMNETQMTAFGRALQPSFTIEYRAYFDQGRHFALDKWFCGSFKNYIPDHYQFGYQLVAWSRERYGDSIWGTVADYAARRPYTILTAKWALHKYFRTSTSRIARATIDSLTTFWRSLPQESNSASLIGTPLTSYTVYTAPTKLNPTTLVALKRDMDRPNHVVAVDLQSGAERRLFYTGSVNTPPVVSDSVLYWSEYRSSTLWEQRIHSRVCSYDLRSGVRRVWRDRGESLFPAPLPEGRVAAVEYDYSGRYAIVLDSLHRFELPDTVSVHGLAFDPSTSTLAFIALSRAGMSLMSVDTTNGCIKAITPPSRVSIYNLRAGAGRLSFNSIASGKDEVHLYDLRAGKEYRLSRSRYGSVAPSAPTTEDSLYFTTYTSEGYLLSRQAIHADSLREVPYSYLPQNRVNPERRKWDVVNLDTVALSNDFQSDTSVKRYRKGLHLFNVHSWAPWNFNPFKIADENRLDISYGATIMSQNLLASTSGFLAYGYDRSMGSLLRGAINYYGLAPKFELSFNYGGGKQSLYGLQSWSETGRKAKEYFDASLLCYVPLTLSSGAKVRTLTPMVEVRHVNSLIYNDSVPEHGYQRIVGSLLFSDYARMAVRDILPRWGYAVRVSAVGAPFQKEFSHIYSLFGRLYLPGLLRHHSLMLRGNIQYQNRAENKFYYKELFPRGANYRTTVNSFRAASADYQFPLCYPDGGIPSILYFSRIRMNLYYDYARMRSDLQYRSTLYHLYRTVTSYGGTITFDMHPLRIPAKTTSVGVYIYKPSGTKGVLTGVNLSLPI